MRRNWKLSSLLTVLVPLVVLTATPVAAAVGSANQTPTTTPTGDVENGEDLFRGDASFSNGGPPCMACHSVSGLSEPGGGQLGIDLSTLAPSLSPQALGPMIKPLWESEAGNPRMMTMKPVFESRPLTDEEIADLGAFFQSTAVAKRSSGATAQLFAYAAAGAALLLLLFALIWRHRLGAVRAPMVRQARATN